MKEPVTQFNLEAAFKALDELDIPEVKSGKFKANRVNLKERLHAKSQTEALLEDYYDVNDTNDLEQASEDRQAEVAKAKLARIEKIVDLDAETEEDILPSYEGKVIIQCPQCMTLFYKNPEDVEASEEDDSVVNVGEVCQHCGNESGYTVIGKVAAVEPEVEEPIEAEPLEGGNEIGADEDEDSVNTDDLIPAEAGAEEEPKEEDNLDLAELPTEDEEEAETSEKEEKEESEEEKKEESLNSSSSTILTEEAEETENNTDDMEEVEDNEESELVSSIDILKTKLDIHGDGDKIIIAEKDQLDNKEAPKIEFTVSEEEFDALAKDFHEDDEEIEADEVTEIDDEEEVKEALFESLEEAITMDNAKKVDDFIFQKDGNGAHESDFMHLAKRYVDYRLNKENADEMSTPSKLAEKIFNNYKLVRYYFISILFKWTDLTKALAERLRYFNYKDEQLTAIWNFIMSKKASWNADYRQAIDYIKQALQAAKKAKSADAQAVAESLTITEDTDEVSDSEFKKLISSEEFTTPVSVEELKGYWGESLHKPIAESLDNISYIAENTLNATIGQELKQVYSNVKAFETKTCTLANNKLKVEGLIKFNSGKTRPTAYTFTEAIVNTKKANKIILEGYNTMLDPKGKFYLECKLANKKSNLLAENLTYSYHINNVLIEKLN